MTNVTIDDVKTILGSRRYCHRGMRAFCARHGIDWSDVVKHGISVSRLRATGDAMAIELADAVEAGVTNRG